MSFGLTPEQVAKTRHQFELERERREGAEAFFKEGDHFGCVRVSNITADDWGARFVISDLPSPGIQPPLREGKTSSSVGSAWETFSFGGRSWYMQYVGLNLIFDPWLIAEIRRLGAAAFGQGEVLDYDGMMTALTAFRSRRSASSPPTEPVA